MAAIGRCLDATGSPRPCVACKARRANGATSCALPCARPPSVRCWWYVSSVELSPASGVSFSAS
eukprot:3736462-Pyramimonas_sp.AAC.1